MQTIGFGKQSFLYLNGLSVDRALPLCDGVELLPAQPDCHAELFLGLGRTDTDISVISLFLPRVKAQLRVRGSGSKDTAKRAWNAVWDALLLGAISGAEVSCNLQSDIPVEELTPQSKVVVTNYHLRGLRDPLQPLSEEQISWVGNHFASAQKLLSRDPFRNAVHCLASYRWHSVPRAQLAILWSGIEGLFGVDSEIVFRISLYTAKFLAPGDREKQEQLFAHVKNLYKSRSKAVHGGTLKGDPAKAAAASAELLNQLVIGCIVAGERPATESLVL